MLFRKMLRDMGRHKTQFLSIFLMAFLGVYIYAGIGGEWKGLQKTVSRYYEETNLANVWLYGTNFSEDDERAVQAIDGITGTERCLVLDSVGKFSNDPKISLHFVEKGDINRCHLVSGEAFSTDKDGIWIDDRFAKAHGLSVGDRMEVTCNGVSLQKEIKGTVYNPEYVYESDGNSLSPDFSAAGYAYLSYQAFPFPGDMVYSEMLLTTDRTDSAKLEEQIGSAIDGNYSVFMTRDDHPSYAMFQNEIEQHRAMGEIFPVAFLAIALLTMLTTMTRIVTNQRTQIGTLKALGFQRGRIARHYIGYGFWLSLVGAALGAVLGPLTLPHLFYPSMSGYYTLPQWKPAITPSFFLMAAATVLLCTLVTYLACRKLLKDTPAKTLRPRSPGGVKHRRLEKTALWKRFGFNAQWNYRDVTRNKVRSLMAVIGVLGCTALLLCAFGMNDDMNDLKDWQYKDINQFESKLTVDDKATDGQIAAAVGSADGQALMEGTVEIKANGVKKSGSLTATDHVTLLRATDKNRKFIRLPDDGVSLSYKMADQLGIKVGDTITWHIYGEENWVTTPVAALFRSPASQGIRLTRESLEKLGYSFKPTAILSPQSVAEKPDGIAGIQRTGDLIADWDNLTGAMMTMVFVLIAAASLLSVVVLYNLGLLSFTEMERELATLKVIGMKSKKLRRLLLTQNLWLSAVGFLLGIPAGKWLLDYMVSTAGDSFDMINVLHPGNLLLSFAITFALSIFVNLLFSRKIKRLDMVASLKGVE